MASNKTVQEYWKEVQPRKGFFDGFRFGQFPTLYNASQTAVTADVLEAGLVFAATILGVSLLIMLPGMRKGDRLSTLVRIVVGVFVLAAIMLSNFGQDWEVAHIDTSTQYRAGLRKEINATVGVKIGLRCVNFTLKGIPVVQSFEEKKVKETIDYNERLSWDNQGWTVGRGGFGPLAGRYNQEFREHQRKGSPYPILWTAEYFTLDGEGVRWGRHYLEAGYYTHILLWSALPLWLLSLILFKMVIRYGAYFSLLTGLCMLAGNACFAGHRNPIKLVIPFEAGPLVFHWGASFWLCLVTGILCFIIGIAVIILELCYQEELADFFGVDFLLSLEEYYPDPAEVNGAKAKDPRWRRTRHQTIVLKTSSAGSPPDPAGGAKPGAAAGMDFVDNAIEMQSTRPPPVARDVSTNETQPSDPERAYRRRMLLPTMRKSQKQNPRPVPPTRPARPAAPPPPSGGASPSPGPSRPPRRSRASTSNNADSMA